MLNFATFHQATGVLTRAEHDRDAFELWAWNEQSRFQPQPAGTHYGVVASGSLMIGSASGEFLLREGMVFCVPGPVELKGAGSAFGITALDYAGLFQLVGPVEQHGRLRYIDGCTDSLLIPPQIKGEPCLNHLHFPPSTDQTQHTHPSFRAGLVLRGHGICKLENENVQLRTGSVFHLPATLCHGFRTEAHSMDVIAFHPDSDCGPEHDDHPMLNRTYVQGVSAKAIPKIRT